MTGVEVPKLGSIKDIVLRQYLLKKAQKEVNKTKLIAMSGLGTAHTARNKELAEGILSIFNDYLNQELYLESVKQEAEQDMKDEYEQYWKQVRPKIKIGKGKDKTTLSMGSLKPIKKK